MRLFSENNGGERKMVRILYKLLKLFFSFSYGFEIYACEIKA